MGSPQHRVAMIGAGLALPPWLDALTALDCEVVTVATTRPDRFESVRERFPRARQCWPPETALEPDDIDFCLNLSPASSHLEGVRIAARAGLPVILEKPLEISFDRGVEAIEVARNAGIPLAVCFQYRYQEGARALKQTIDSGILGEIKAVTLDVMWWRSEDYYSESGRGTYARDGGGVLLTQAVHALDLLVWFFGLPAQVFSTMTRGAFREIETEDVATGLFAYPGGHFGTVVATTGARSAEEVKIRVLGSEMTAVLVGNTLELFGNTGRVGSGGDIGPAERISATDPMSFPSRWHTEFLGATLRAFESGQPCPISGEEALLSLSLIDAMERSAREEAQVAPRLPGGDRRRDSTTGHTEGEEQ